MKNKNMVISLVLAVIITITIFLFPMSLTTTDKGVIVTTSSMGNCLCGGCCVGCPGACNTIGTPFLLYYWGFNGLAKRSISELSILGLVIDLLVWLLLMFIIYKFVFKRQ